MEIIFNNTNILWFLISIPVIIAFHFLSLEHKKEVALQFAQYRLLKSVAGKFPSNFAVLIIRIIMISLLVFAAAGMALVYKAPSATSDFVLAIDASPSMGSKDFAPDRLEASKEAAKNFVDSLQARTSIGVVSFAAKSFVEQPLTTKFGEVKEAIGRIEIESSGGTGVGDAIITSVNLLVSSDKARSIILLTDGQSNTGIHPAEAALYARQYDVAIFTIGMATEEGGIVKGDFVSRLDEETLENVSAQTDGEYFKVNDLESLKSAYRKISTIQGFENVTFDLSIFLMLAVLICLFLDWGLSMGRYRIIP